MTEAGLLEARDARQRELERALAQLGSRGGCVVLAGTNVPGPAKHRPGLLRLFHAALDALGRELPLVPALAGFDLLGPFQIAYAASEAEAAKRIAVALEEAAPSGRILDLDVYRPDGTQVDRARLGLPQRACLVCAEPARECIRARRHAQAEVLARVDALLRTHVDQARTIQPGRLAVTLHQGAVRELEVTPKPGLVDRRDAGSHPDLSFAAMLTSAHLLPVYYDDLLQAFGAQGTLPDFVQAGVRAEDRMQAEIHSNGHRGYIFLSGLVLLAACRCQGRLADLRPAIADLARQFFAAAPVRATPGAQVRAGADLGGIRAEAELGLPAIFDHAWPAYRNALAGACEQAPFHLMAALMRTVEDTTAVRRCGPEGLARIRRDGAALQQVLDRGQDPVPFLAALNEDYRAANLTMGGVADCMALTFALHGAVQ
jgi:triphosphoribosyl-dephospho-CoA synthase